MDDTDTGGERSRAHATVHIADSGGVVVAILAALCCAGTPLIVSGLAAVGLGFLRKDSILWPLMIVALAVALWGFRAGLRLHGNFLPMLVALLGAAMLLAGVIFVHGFPARVLIATGALSLIAATLWNISARVACQRRTRLDVREAE